jgi:subtilisin family serine protease
MLRPDDADFRGWRFETFEERLAFAAQPVADFWIDPAAEPIVEPSSAFIEPLAIASGPSGNPLAAAREQFGLRGGKQTVAIIDSGIAYDHVALGGGLGSSHRVVGGWDFAENDANPYDDGPAGFHGTHVAGIVGANDRRNSGLAPDVDLVALRVFDDQGLGHFTWVEQALAWVHDHRLAFENPITTVNLSLGSEWNASSPPNWTHLEDELKQLADDGIFVAVAAGNAFQTMNAAGLAYPAASTYVVPVASVDASGNLSRFSQRDSRVLAAPGEKIKSTLPDAFYGGDGNKNDWGPSSGTSMASPYVAGASVLVREAMQNLGYTQITQGTIIDLLRRTADTIYDTATSASYQRINLERALTTLIGSDDYGSTEGAALALGPLSTTLNFSGVIGSASDRDYFQFVAAQSGRVTLSLNGSEYLGTSWIAAPGSRIDGSKLTLDVVAGQRYTVGVAAGGVTIGKYNVAVQLTGAAAPSTSARDLGGIEQTKFRDLALTGNDTWFQVTASRGGRFTTEALFAHTAGNIDLEIYDSRARLIGISRGTGNSERVDLDVRAGDKLLVRLRGANENVDLRLTNLVTIIGAQVQIAGTPAADSLRWQAGAQQQIVVNGVSYRVASNSQVRFDGSGGNDAILLAGLKQGDSVTHWPSGVQVVGASYSVTANGIENVQIGDGTTGRIGSGSLGTAAVTSSYGLVGPIAPAVRQHSVDTPARVPLSSSARVSELAFALLGLECETDCKPRSRPAPHHDQTLLDAVFCTIGSE